MIGGNHSKELRSAIAGYPKVILRRGILIHPSHSPAAPDPLTLRAPGLWCQQRLFHGESRSAAGYMGVCCFFLGGGTGEVGCIYLGLAPSKRNLIPCRVPLFLTYSQMFCLIWRVRCVCLKGHPSVASPQTIQLGWRAFPHHVDAFQNRTASLHPKDAAHSWKRGKQSKQHLRSPPCGWLDFSQYQSGVP